MQQCVFDPEADAVLLFDKAWAYYNDEGNMLTEHHVRLKILRESGVHAADIEIPYYADKNFETITDVRAAVLSSSS